jgi:hypothetical protein
MISEIPNMNTDPSKYTGTSEPRMRTYYITHTYIYTDTQRSFHKPLFFVPRKAQNVLKSPDRFSSHSLSVFFVCTAHVKCEMRHSCIPPVVLHSSFATELQSSDIYLTFVFSFHGRDKRLLMPSCLYIPFIPNK